MMSSTYEKIMEDSVLQSRVDFARLILMIELQVGWLQRPPCGLWKPWDLHAGLRGAGAKKDRYFHVYQKIQANQEGYGTTNTS